MIKINSPYQPIKVFNGIIDDDEYSNSGLFKIENIPTLKYNSEEYDCPSEEWNRFLVDNPSFKEILEKIGNASFGSGYDIREDMYQALNIMGSFKSPTKQAYINIGGDRECFLTSNLNNFAEEYYTIEQWDITQWKEI